MFGQIEGSGTDQWGLLLAKDSPLTECVDLALQTLEDSGELDADHHQVDERLHRSARSSPSSPRTRLTDLDEPRWRRPAAHAPVRPPSTTPRLRARRRQHGRRGRPRSSGSSRSSIGLGPRRGETFFDRETFAEAFPEVLRAFVLDLRIFLVCAPLIVVFGLAIALARSVRSPVLFPLRLGATLYVDIVRGVPILLWLFLIGFGGAGLINKRRSASARSRSARCCSSAGWRS